MRWGRVEVHWSFFLLTAWLLYLDDQNILLMAVLACALHELGHIAAIYCFGEM